MSKGFGAGSLGLIQGNSYASPSGTKDSSLTEIEVRHLSNTNINLTQTCLLKSF
jgi:hypothetical protein